MDSSPLQTFHARLDGLIQGKVSMQEGGLTCKGPFQPQLGDHRPAKSLWVGEQHIRALIQLGRRGQEKVLLCPCVNAQELGVMP